MGNLGGIRIDRIAKEKFSDLLSDSVRRVHKSSTVYYVDSNTGSSAYNGKRIESPFATIAQALSAATASQGDTIIVLPNHAETVTSSITVSKADVTIKGIALGSKRPTLTGNGTIDVLDITAAGVTIDTLLFAAPETDAQTADINVAAANCAIINTKHIGSKTSNNKVDIITLTSAANDVLIDGVLIYNSVVEVVGGIVFEGALARGEVRNCFVMDTIGFTDGCISDEATATHLYIHHNTFSNAKADTVVMEFGNNSTGVCAYNNVNGRHTTIASNVAAGTGMAFFQNFAVEEAAKNGIVIPVADAD